jgi:hypothetical protein
MFCRHPVAMQAYANSFMGLPNRLDRVPWVCIIDTPTVLFPPINLGLQIFLSTPAGQLKLAPSFVLT